MFKKHKNQIIVSTHENIKCQLDILKKKSASIVILII